MEREKKRKDEKAKVPTNEEKKGRGRKMHERKDIDVRTERKERISS